MACASIVPSVDDAMHVKLLLCCMLASSSTFLPTGVWSSGVRSVVPVRQRTNGIGEPTATHSRLMLPPSMISLIGSGRRENVGGTRRSFTYNCVGLVCSVPTEFSATHSNLPWSSRTLSTIWRPPTVGRKRVILEHIFHWIRQGYFGQIGQIDGKSRLILRKNCLKTLSFASFSCFIAWRAAIALPSIIVYRWLFISSRLPSLSQWIFGVGFPVARHCITAVCPISMTRVCGFCVITGKPLGVLSAVRARFGGIG